MANDANETHWPKIQSLAEDSKTSELRALLSSPHEAKEKIALHRFAIRALMFREWRGKNLDLLIPLGDAAIAAAENAGEVDQANIICFNMSSNLADCWNDGLKRENRHFQKGLEYADRAIEFRKQLKKGPGPFSMAYWAKGAHELSLGDLGAAETDFVLSLRAAHELAEANSKPTTLTKDAAYEVLLAQGYVSIAQMARGSRDAKTTFDQVIRAFEEMKDLSPEAKEDAEICLDQLRYVGAKFS